MDILFLSQLVPYPIDAGPKVRSYHVLQYLFAAGHKVTLVAFRREGDRSEYLAHLEQFCSDIHTVPMVRSRTKDLWHMGASILQNRPFLIARDDVAAMRELVGSLIQSREYDAIHADQLWMAQYALGAQAQLDGLASKTRLVLDQHNAVQLIPQRLADSESSSIMRLVLEREARRMKVYEPEICARFDTVVWVTDDDRSVIESQLNRPVDGVTIPICVDPEMKIKINRKPRANRVTFLGNLHWPPNAAGIVWFAQEVWTKVVEQVPDACLTVIGKEPPRELLNVQKEIRNLDVTGYVDDPEPLLAETAVFIVPLHAGGGMRVKIIDAWSWGLPIVSTSVGAEGIQYRDGEDILIADSAAAFAEAVARILAQPELGSRLSAAGRQKVETRYDWHNTYRAWDDVYPIAETVLP